MPGSIVGWRSHSRRIRHEVSPDSRAALPFPSCSAPGNGPGRRSRGPIAGHRAAEAGRVSRGLSGCRSGRADGGAEIQEHSGLEGYAGVAAPAGHAHHAGVAGHTVRLLPCRRGEPVPPRHQAGEGDRPQDDPHGPRHQQGQLPGADPGHLQQLPPRSGAPGPRAADRPGPVRRYDPRSRPPWRGGARDALVGGRGARPLHPGARRTRRPRGRAEPRLPRGAAAHESDRLGHARGVGQ